MTLPLTRHMLISSLARGEIAIPTQYSDGMLSVVTAPLRRRARCCSGTGTLKGNECMNNNIDLNNFDKMLELAEFGAKRHNERRQNLFKVIIAYITLLSLALHYSEKIFDSLSTVIAIGLLVFIHVIYLWWLWVTLKASINDVRRRDFYLKKAESFSYHLSQNQFSDFSPKSSNKVTLNLGSGAGWKITERCLFKMRGPKIIGKSSCKEPPPPKCWRDIHFLALATVPTALAILFGLKLIGTIYPWGISIFLARILLISNLLG